MCAALQRQLLALLSPPPGSPCAKCATFSSVVAQIDRLSCTGVAWNALCTDAGLYRFYHAYLADEEDSETSALEARFIVDERLLESGAHGDGLQ